MEPDTELRRYVSLGAVISMLRDRKLRLTRIDQFNDPFEGSVPKRQIDDQVPLFSSSNGIQMVSARLTIRECLCLAVAICGLK